mmetsp:Transcript_12134/g.32715  ORF Transcript_12134/g.32715 Transcript_12134/m.32715 type:complete len:88 (-) Transcript_12134:174-437(-)
MHAWKEVEGEVEGGSKSVCARAPPFNIDNASNMKGNGKRGGSVHSGSGCMFECEKGGLQEILRQQLEARVSDSKEGGGKWSMEGAQG